jgi:hypothetical protein
MKISTRYFLFFLPILSVSCQITKEEKKIIGKITSKSSHVRYVINIKRNHTFYYKYNSIEGLCDQEGSGNWMIKDDSLILKRNKFIDNCKYPVLKADSKQLFCYGLLYVEFRRHLWG